MRLRQRHWPESAYLELASVESTAVLVGGFRNFIHTYDGGSFKRQRTDTAMLRGEQLEAALSGGIPGFRRLSKQVLQLASRQPCGLARDMVFLGVDMLC